MRSSHEGAVSRQGCRRHLRGHPGRVAGRPRQRDRRRPGRRWRGCPRRRPTPTSWSATTGAPTTRRRRASGWCSRWRPGSNCSTSPLCPTARQCATRSATRPRSPNTSSWRCWPCITASSRLPASSARRARGAPAGSKAACRMARCAARRSASSATAGSGARWRGARRRSACASSPPTARRGRPMPRSSASTRSPNSTTCCPCATRWRCAPRSGRKRRG